MTQTKVEAPFVENNRPFRNLIINGDMSIFQRATATTTATSGNYTTVDRFLFYESTDGVYSTEKEDLSAADQATTGQRTALQCDVTTADGTIGAAQFAAIYQRIEAQNLQHLLYGTSAAKNLTLSFWVKSNKTGTYCVAIVKDDSTAYYLPIEYTISSADTWEKKVINISPTAGSTSLITGANGAIADDSGIGIYVSFGLAWGSNFHGTNNTWVTNAYLATSNQVNWMDSTSNNFFLTGVQLEVGGAASDFEHLPFDVQLTRCHRYYYVHTQPQTGNNEPMGMGMYYSDSQVNAHIPFKVPMRTSPSLVCTDASNHFVVYRNGGSDAVDNWSAGELTENVGEIYNNSDFSGSGYSQAGCVLSTNNASAKLAFDAEL